MGPTPPQGSNDSQLPPLPFDVLTSDAATSSEPASSNPIAAALSHVVGTPTEAYAQDRAVVDQSIKANDVVESSYITAPENFGSWPSYNSLADQVADMKPENVDALATACKTIADMGFDEELQAITNLIGKQWTGAAATAATAAVSSMSGDVTELTTGITDVGTRLEFVSSTADLMRLKIPFKPELDAASVVATASTGASARLAAAAIEENERLEAVVALETIYAPSYTNAGTGVPVLPEPKFVQGASGSTGGYAPTGSPGIQAGPGAGSGGGTPTGSPIAQNPAPTAPTGEQAPGAPGKPEGPASTSAAATMNPNASGPQGHVGQGSVREGLTSTNTGTGGAPGHAVGPAAYARSAGVGGGASGVGSRSSGEHDGATDQPNSVGMVPGVPPGAAALGAGAGAAIGAASQTSLARPGMGMSGAPMMAPRGANTGGDDDKEHETPSYLITVDNGNDLVGPIEPVAPPVIGA